MNRMSDDIIESEMKSFHLKSNFYKERTFAGHVGRKISSSRLFARISLYPDFLLLLLEPQELMQ